MPTRMELGNECGRPLTSMPMELSGSSAKGNRSRIEESQNQDMRGLLSK